MRSAGVLWRGILAAGATTVFLGFAAAASSADVLLDESFSGPAAGIPLRVGGSFVPCLTASTNTGQANVPGCAAGQPSIPAGGDPDGTGALRLTDNAHDRSGFAIYRHAFPFTQGVRFTFTTFAYNGTRVPGYGAADGISVFLADGSVGASAPGAFGGSLGYAQKSVDFDATVPDVPGVPGGYLGVGIDEFGNFANDREARGYGCSSRVDQNLHPNFVSLRGAGIAGSDWLRGYCLLDREPAPGVLDQPDATSRTAPGVPHTFRIEVDPLGNADGTPNPTARVHVFADMANTGTFVPVLDSPLPPDPPATFEFGLAASTGLGTNVHEIRALRLETVSELPRYTLTKTHAAPLIAGGTGAFTIQAALAPDGGAAYAPVDLDDPLPDGLTIAALPHGAGWTCTGTLVGGTAAHCTYPASLADPIRPGTQLPPVTVPVRVAPDATGDRVNVARLTGPEILTPVEAPDPFTLVPSVDVSIAKQADPTRIAAGGRTSFVLVVTNHGPSDATSVVVVDDAPAGLAFDDALASQGRCTRTAATLNCALGALRAGASAQITVDATATPEATGRTLRNIATVSADADADPTNNTDDATVQVVGPDDPDPPPSDAGARLRIDKEAARASVRVGAPVDYVIRVRNTGSATAHDVLLTDTATLPGAIQVDAQVARACTRQDGVAQCRLGDIAAGHTVTIHARVVFDRAGSAVNTATLSPPDGPLDDRSDTATVRVLGGAALALTKTASRVRLRVGELVRYRITVRSLGPEPAERVRVCDRLPSALRLVSARGSRAGCWTLPGLASGAARSFTVVARAAAPAGRARNLATARADNTRAVRALRSVTVVPRGATAPTLFTG